ncbi:ribonuclease H-like [Stegodyphus dumicola]|uniref:ribonuclease H-like n=1 Tax=Stegodyphus dumicola TaxID=202533 RepID=UPI0015A90C42|nr:ribonuclease H-like [Stegodyphus dumicola]
MLNCQNTSENAICIYTNGSKLDGGVRCVAVIKCNDEVLQTWKGHLESGNTVFQAEVAAIRQAIEVTEQFDGHTFRIFTDSHSASYAIRNPYYSSTQIADIQALLRESETRMTIHISWIKAHAEYQGNEEADELDKEAERNIITQPVPILLPRSHLKRQIWEKALKQWQEEWDAASSSR